MLQKTKGIVLHTLKYNDTSIIVDMYTELSGRASFLVAVPRSRKAAVKSVLFQPLSFIEFEADYRPNATLYRIKEAEHRPLFAYLQHSIIWLDECGGGFANFHLVFLMRLSRFLGLYPNLEDYHTGDYFDLLNACFTSIRPQLHSSYINPEEAGRLRQLMRMNYETMHLFGMSRAERARCLTIMNDYYRLHLPDFPALKSLEVLKELFD